MLVSLWVINSYFCLFFVDDHAVLGHCGCAFLSSSIRLLSPEWSGDVSWDLVRNTMDLLKCTRQNNNKNKNNYFLKYILGRITNGRHLCYVDKSTRWAQLWEQPSVGHISSSHHQNMPRGSYNSQGVQRDILLELKLCAMNNASTRTSLATIIIFHGDATLCFLSIQ